MDLLRLQAGGNVAGCNAQRQPLRNRGLTDAGLTDQAGVIFGTPAQDLYHARNLFIAPDDFINFPRRAFAVRSVQYVSSALRFVLCFSRLSRLGADEGGGVSPPFCGSSYPKKYSAKMGRSLHRRA